MAEVQHRGSPAAQPMAPAQVSSPASEAWRVHGRDSPAGKALYKLYGGDFHGRSAGAAYHQANKDKHEAALAAGWSPTPKESPPVAIDRPTINYPRFGREKHPKEAPLPIIPRRKPADQILRELEETREQQRAARPAPRGPLLDAAEKERCAMMMRYRGKPPAVTVPERAREAAAARHPAKRSEREELQHLFDQVMQEIEERKAFLADLESYGALKRDMQQQVRNEIRQRVDDLERIDRLMASCDSVAQQQAGNPPSMAVVSAALNAAVKPR